ncbi:hypothetical protein DFH27DRAFT_609290 [Peziza echinospora]|nr:hypothetical protein DFH27DRAFT_609290 [Peziza echinospora]
MKLIALLLTSYVVVLATAVPTGTGSTTMPPSSRSAAAISQPGYRSQEAPLQKLHAATKLPELSLEKRDPTAGEPAVPAVATISEPSSLAVNLEQILACVNAITNLGMVCFKEPGSEACIASLAAIMSLEGCMPSF